MMDIFERSSSRDTFEISIPSIRIAPEAGSIMRKSASIRLPARPPNDNSQPQDEQNQEQEEKGRG